MTVVPRTRDLRPLLARVRRDMLAVPGKPGDPLRGMDSGQALPGLTQRRSDGDPDLWAGLLIRDGAPGRAWGAVLFGR